MKKAAVLLCMILAVAALAGGIDIETLDVKGGLIWIGNAPTDALGIDAAPDPLATVVGVSLPLRFSSFFLLVPEIRYFGTPYGVDNGRVVPVETEFADSAYVLGLLIEARATLEMRIHQAIVLGGYASPTLVARVPGRIWGDADRGTIAGYHYGKGRFFYPEAGFYLDWDLPFTTRSQAAETANEGEFDAPPVKAVREMHLIADFSTYLPLFHAWDGEGVPFYDQMMVSGMVGLKIYLNPPEGTSP